MRPSLAIIQSNHDSDPCAGLYSRKHLPLPLPHRHHLQQGHLPLQSPDLHTVLHRLRRRLSGDPGRRSRDHVDERPRHLDPKRRRQRHGLRDRVPGRLPRRFPGRVHRVLPQTKTGV